MLNYQQQLHSIPVGSAGNFYYAASTMPSATSNASGPGSGPAHTLASSEATYAPPPAPPLELDEKLHQAAYVKDKEIANRRELDKMHRFSVDNLIELKQDAFAKSKLTMELANNFGKLDSISLLIFIYICILLLNIKLECKCHSFE